jgi:membrane protease YdiL (CAAX protease family)
LTPDLDAPPSPPTAPRPHFSLAVTVVLAVLTAVVVWTFYYRDSDDPLRGLSRPLASLDRLMGREMELAEALEAAPAWERRVYAAVGLEPHPLEEAAAWYEELGEDGEARAHVRRVILLGEAGRLDEALAAFEPLEQAGERLGAWLRLAYGERSDSAEAAEALAALLGEPAAELPGWFADTLARRLAARAGDDAARSAADQAIAERGRALLLRVRVLTATELGLLVVTAAVLWRWGRGRFQARIAEAPLPPPWMARDGLGLFVRAAAGYAAIPVAAGFLVPAPLLPGGVIALAGGLPMLWFTWRYLRRSGASLLATFGLRPAPGSAGRLCLAAVVLLTLSVVGEGLILLALDRAGMRSHWADGFLEQLIWGSAAAVAADTVDSALWAPLVEEMAFRGLLYPTLRLWLPMLPAALASGGLFAAVHGYGLAGLLAIAWTGVVWAVGYERTGSLLPGMLAHAAGNLGITLLYVVLLRV